MPAGAQMLQVAKELQLKQRMAEKVDAMSKDHKEAMMVVTDNLKAWSETMSSAVSLLHQTLIQQRSNP